MYICSKLQAYSFTFTKKSSHQSFSRLSTYHSIRAIKCLQTCNFLFGDRKECLGKTAVSAKASPPTSISYIFCRCMSNHPILPEKYCTECILCKSKLVQIALAGLGIHPQNSQRENFTHEPPCFDTNVFGVPVIVKSSLTSSSFQTFASTHHSNLMMPAWGLLLWKMTRKNTYKRNFFTDSRPYARPQCFETAHIFT